MRISTRLGLAAGALLYLPIASANSQVVPPPASEVPIPVKPKTDSGPDSTQIKTDTLKAPIGRFADPALYEIGPQYDWNRTQLFATGAVTLIDLLDRIPGVTTLRSGWIATPQTASYVGGFERVRIFYDGIEIDNLDSRTGGVLDLASIQIWTLEHLSIERSAGELRIYMRTWRVENTDPYTRADVLTGNEETNLYRGYYGKRSDSGGVIQFAGQQYGTTSPRFAGSGDALALLTRVGIAKKSWSVDAYMMRNHPTRDLQRPLASSGRPPVLGLDATYTDAYVRAAIGGVNSGPWLQFTIGSLGFKGTTEPDRTAGAAILGDTLERRASETQYVVNGGMTLGALRVEVLDRLRALGGATYNSASARGDLAIPFATLSGFIEHDGFKGRTSADVGARFQPLPFFALSGSFANTLSIGASSVPNLTAVRGEAAIKLFGPWAAVGLMTADRVAGLAPLVYDTTFLPTEAGQVRGKTASLRGPIAAGFGIDAWITQWDESGAYRPKYESRSELNYVNEFRKRFPRGDFAVRAATAYEYRSHTLFPSSEGDVETSAAKTLSVLLEIRILRAVISFQQRNLLGYPYEIVPGFEMPRVLAEYGVRWDFWN